jgi:hypothetical protein
MKTRINIIINSIIIMLCTGLVSSSCEKGDDIVKDTPDDENLPLVNGYPVVETNQTIFYDNYAEISEPSQGMDFYGQDASYIGNPPLYEDNGDGTVTDMVTGLMWSQSPDLNRDGEIDVDDKLSFDQAVASVSSFNLAGYDDWRLPTIKELYSLIMFSGEDINPMATSSADLNPFIDSDYFEFGYGDTNAGERIIDAQFATATKYVTYTGNNMETMFGVNFADGRIKGYGLHMRDGDKKFYVLYVRGNESYGKNSFSDNGDGTVTDNATGLMWMQADNGEGILWKDALSYAENLDYAGYSDWRLPDVKELQSIVDYTRSPSTTSSAAIAPVFSSTQITNEQGEDDYPWYWSGTTHAKGGQHSGGHAAYVCFGRAFGYMDFSGGSWTDIHGAGSQRSDYKFDNLESMNYVPEGYYFGNAPQGDAVRSYNYVRCVRNVD